MHTLSMVDPRDGDGVARAVEQRLRGVVPRSALRVLLIAIEGAAERLGRDELARRCGVARRTLHRRLSSAGLRSPSDILAWAQVLVTCHLQERGPTLARVAAHLGCDGSSSIVHLFRRYTGHTPGWFSMHGGVSTAIELLESEIAVQRALRSRAAGDVAE